MLQQQLTVLSAKELIFTAGSLLAAAPETIRHDCPATPLH